MFSIEPFPSPSLLTLMVLLIPIPAASQELVDLTGDDRPLFVDQEEVISVGSIDGEDWEVFSRVHDVAFDAHGNLYVLDTRSFRVVKIGPDGRLIAESGREGGGPGEFRQPLAFAVTRAGEVRVFDLGNQGFTVFNTDGSFKNTARVAGGELFIPNGGLSSLPGGAVVDGGPSSLRMLVSGPANDSNEPRSVNLITISDEAEIVSAYEAWNPLSMVGNQRERAFSGGGIQMVGASPRAFDPGLFVGVFPDGFLAVVDTTTYTVKVVNPGRGIVRILRRPFEPKAVTRRDRAAERERQLEEIAARTGSGGNARAHGSGGGSINIGASQVAALLEARVESLEFGEEMPVLAGMAVDWEGRIWVERTGERVGEDGPIDVIDADGRYMGSIDPGSFRIPDAFGPNGLVAFVEAGDMDEPRVDVRRISLR